ncbi:MAG: ABC transporter permease, partial [Acidobacteria bacterium]|nr:ABC transporter permease [Acidobacteriota bacterium]
LVVVTLALGIGANTAIFSVTNAVILKPLPFKGPDRLVHLWENSKRGVRYRRGQDSGFIYARPGSLYDWRERSRSYESMSGYRWATMMLTGGERAEMVWANRVADHFFETLGVGAQLGRVFTGQDYELSAQPVVVLSEALWRNRYGADPGVIGRAISLDNIAHTVVGVMPPEFYPTRFESPQLWTPYAFTAEDKTNRVAWGWTVFARLKREVKIEQAQTEMELIATQMEQAYPEHYQNMGVVLVPVDAEIIGSLGRLFFLLLCAVGLVLLVACVNVANLLLVRAAEREREFAVRSALGASRGRLVRQLLTESLLLASLGGALGLLLASLGVPSLLVLLPAAANVPRLDEVRLDWQAFAFTAGVSLVTGILFGLVPALRAVRPDLNEGLKESGRGNAASARRRQLGRLLVTGEVALSLLLLVGAGLLAQSFIHLQRTDPGFITSRLLTLEIRVPDYRYGKFAEGTKNEGRIRLYDELERRLSSLPGVESAAIASKLPVKHGPNPWGISIEGRPAPPPGSQEGGAALSRKTGRYHHGSVAINRVTPGYARTLGLRLLHGRLLNEGDTSAAPMVALISDTTARKYWPSGDPIGQRFTVDYTSWFPKMTVVGVVADIKTDRLDKPQYPEIYWPQAQAPSANARILIRTKVDPDALASAVRDKIGKIDRDLPVQEMSSMDGVIADTLWRARLAAWLLGLFAALAVALAAAGLYGVLSYSVSQRTQELGLRMALGARKSDVLRLVIGEGMRLVVIGLAVGLTAAAVFGRLLASQLYGVKANDPPTFVAVSLLLVCVAFVACFIPARRAAKTDPIIALRRL